MRGALKKPTTPGPQIQRPSAGFNPQRELRAKKIAKHNQINRFGHPIGPANQSTRPNQTVQGEVITRSKSSATASTNKTTVMPSMVASASHQKLERLLDAALVQADAHKKALKYQAARHFWQKPGFMGRKRWLKLSLLLVFAIVGVFFAAWQRMPQLSIKMAAAKAHVSASLPEYKPTGYSLAEPASVQDGSVILKYKTPYNTAGFELAQKVSNMTSANLTQTIIPVGSQVQTSQVSGNIVYIYGPNNNAAWVNDGKLYTIKDKSKLSSDQIIKIVQSMAN